MNTAALPEDAVQISIETTGRDLINLAEAQRGAQTSGNPLDVRGTAATGFAADFLDCSLQRLGGEANGMRKTLMQHQEFRDAIGLDLGGVGFAVGFKSGAGAQQADPFQVTVLGFAMIRLLKRAEMHADQNGQAHSPLEEPASLNELPALAVSHGGVGNALKQVRAFLDGVKELARAP